MQKIPYAIMSPQVDKLYEKWFAEEDLDQLDKHILFIKEFIKACGWEEEAYLRELMELNRGN